MRKVKASASIVFGIIAAILVFTPFLKHRLRSLRYSEFWASLQESQGEKKAAHWLLQVL